MVCNKTMRVIMYNKKTISGTGALFAGKPFSSTWQVAALLILPPNLLRRLYLNASYSSLAEANNPRDTQSVPAVLHIGYRQQNSSCPRAQSNETRIDNNTTVA